MAGDIVSRVPRAASCSRKGCAGASQDCANAALRKCRKCRIDVTGTADIGDTGRLSARSSLRPVRLSGWLRYRKNLGLPGRRCGAPLRRHLTQQLQAFAAERTTEKRHAGDVSARPVEAGDQTGLTGSRRDRRQSEWSLVTDFAARAPRCSQGRNDATFRWRDPSPVRQYWPFRLRLAKFDQGTSPLDET